MTNTANKTPGLVETKTRTYPCGKCSKRGFIRAFSHIAGGVCFSCGGAGVCEKHPRNRTINVGITRDENDKIEAVTVGFEYGYDGSGLAVSGLAAKSRAALLGLVHNGLRAVLADDGTDARALDFSAMHAAFCLVVLGDARAEDRAVAFVGVKGDYLADRIAEARELIAERKGAAEHLTRIRLEASAAGFPVAW